MSKKSAATRLAEIWNTLGNNCSGKTKQNIEAAMRRQNLDEDRIAAALHLGWWAKGGATEKTRRLAVRASTFLEVIQLDLSYDQIPAQLQANYRRTQKELDDNIAAILNAFSHAVKAEAQSTQRQVASMRTVVRPEWMPSIQAGGGKQRVRERQLAVDGLEAASAIMNRSWAFLVKAARPGTAGRNHYERWFGAFDADRYKTVKERFQQIHSVICSSDVCVHLRTSDTVGQPDDTPGAAPNAKIKQTIQTPNGPYDIDTLYAWAIPKGADGKPHVFLCGVYYSSNMKGPHAAIKAKDRGSGADNVGGVMIHELSHSLCGTRDVVHPDLNAACYGRALCSDLALQYPDDAIDNADNYEIFCEDTEGLSLI